MFKRLAQIAEAGNQNSETPQDVLAATCAVIQSIGGRYVKSTEATPPARATADHVRSVLWPGAYGTGDQRCQHAASIVSQPAIQQRAKEILDWFNNLPATQKSSSDYMSKVDQIIRSGNVTSRDVAVVASLWSVFDRQVGFGATKYIRNWPSQWGDVKMVYKQPATVLATQATYTGNGFQVSLLLNSGHVARFFSLYDYQTGENLTITGYLEPNTYGKNKDNPKIEFVPERRWKKTEVKRITGNASASDDDDDQPGATPTP